MTTQIQTVFTPPAKETPATVRDLINVNLALSDVLAEESRLMDVMQIQKVGELQERKLRLISLMERYSLYMSKHPEILAAITPQERADLRKAGETFRAVSRKNYDKLMVARAVNNVVVKAVTHEISKARHNPIYSASGNVTNTYRAPISVTLNETI